MTLVSAMALGRGLHRRLRPAARRADRPGARPPGRGALDARTFLRAFTFGHVRQLDRVLADTLTRAWVAGAGPGDQRLVVDVDSFVGEVFGRAKQGAAFGYTRVARLPPADRHARRHRRGPARPPQEGVGEHLARDAALHR